MLDQRAAGEENNQTAKLVAKTQQMDNLVKYMTQSDLDLMAQQDMWYGCHALATRLRKLGAKSMKESTKKASAALLAILENKRTSKQPSSDACYVRSQRFTNEFHSSQEALPAGVVPLAVYTDNPLDLPPGHLLARQCC